MSTQVTKEPGDIITISSGVKINKTHTTHSGRLTKVRFVSDKNHFTICTIGGVTCKGIFFQPTQSCFYILTGVFEFDVKYNEWQFIFSKIEKNTEESLGLKEYLYREAPNVGPVMAGKIVAKFGKDALNIIETQWNRLCEVGISEGNAKNIHEWYKSQRSNVKIKEKLYEIGLSQSQVYKIISKYGSYADKQIREDCFSLTEIHGFGFITVGKIADLVGVPKNDPGRIKAALLYEFDSITDSGHTCFPATELVREVCGLVGVRQEEVWPQLDVLLNDGKLVSSETDFEKYKEEFGIIL